MTALCRLFAALLCVITLAGSGGPTAWVMSDGTNQASVDLNFQNGLYYQDGIGVSSTPASYVTVSRASTAYEDDVSGAWSSFGNNVLRVTNKGALMEESRTNSIRNNSMQGATVTPSVMPTNWGGWNTAFNGVTNAVTGLGTDNGIDYIDFTFTGTAGPSGAFNMTLEPSRPAAANGQNWTGSVFYKLVSGSFGDATLRINMAEYNSGVFLQQTITSLPNPTSNWQRANVVYTNSNASTNQEDMLIGVATVNGSAYSYTLRIGWPQLELGAFVTSPIRTTNATVTRAADVVTLKIIPVWQRNQTAFVKATPSANSTSIMGQLMVNDGTNNNRLELRRENPTTQKVIGQSSASGQFWGPTVGSQLPLLSSSKTATGLAPLDQAAYVNGSQISTNATGIPATIYNTVIIGGGNGQWDGYIERVALWPNQRLANASLQALTQ